ncbi:MAG TPA: hypothetical protein VNY52_03875 [Solirubrobacteraceae bacterium]|jgi:hypothetical protein|nr:hypothetical protein [Solirubrobacteraceae bacterium]
MSAKIAVLGLVIEEPGPAHRLTAKLRQRLSSAGFVDSNVYSALTRLERDGLVRAVEMEVEAESVGEGAGARRSLTMAQDTACGTRRVAAGQPQGGVGRLQSSVGPDRADAGFPRAEGRLPRVDAELRRVEAGQLRANGGSLRVDVGWQRADREPPRASTRRTPGSRTDSRSFEATPAGVRHFEEWLLGSSTAPPLRDELHMKVALCQPHNLPRLVELVYGQELVCLARVREMKRSFERVRPPAPERWSGLVQVHIRDAELAFWDARLTWLQGVRESLEGMHAEYERAMRRRLGG